MLTSCFVFQSSLSVAAAGYATPDLLNGSDNIFLSYTFSSNPASGHRTKEQYRPLVGYYDTADQLKDIFFDSFLFLPCVGETPSGGRTYRDNENPANFSDWQLFIDDVFLDGFNIKALDAAVGEMKAVLGGTYSNYKANVFLSVLYPVKTQTNFGDVDGDGVVENFSKLADRQKAIRWIIDEQIERYEACDFKNLNLVGFYWFEENYASDDTNETSVITTMTGYTHSLGYKAIWIPYYRATGYSSWKSYGFDVANYQPNYMFNTTATSSRITTACNTAKSLGMGIEIESSGQMFSSVNYYNRYMYYLKLCSEAGASQGVKMYYNDAVPGVYYTAYQSEVPEIRRIYDLTYQYASQTLNTADITFLKQTNQYEDYSIVSLGKSYTSTASYTNTTMGYGDVSGEELTDGIFGESNYDSEWIGFNKSNTVSGFFFVNLDLGVLYNNLSLFSIEVNELLGAGISLPESVEYLISQDGVNYTSIGEGEFVLPSLSMMLVKKELITPVTARYIQVKIKPGISSFVFVSELSIGALKVAAPSLTLRANTSLILNKTSGLCEGFQGTMTAAELKAKFTSGVVVTNSAGNALQDTANIGTGTVITYYYNNRVAEVYTVCIKGDINGDGAVSAVDYLLVKRAFLGTYSLSNEKLKAADINEDSKVNSIDYLSVKRHFYGTFSVYA